MLCYFKYLARTLYWRLKNRSYYSQELGRWYGRTISYSIYTSNGVLGYLYEIDATETVTGYNNYKRNRTFIDGFYPLTF